MSRRVLIHAKSRTILLTLLLAMLGRWATAKTIQAVPDTPVIAETTWYFINCTTSAGLGSYSINVAPMYGAVTFANVSGPLPGCPAGSPSLPAVQAYYTWTDTSTTASSDFFELYYNLNGQVAAVLDVDVILSGGGGGCSSSNVVARAKLPDLMKIPYGTFITTKPGALSSVATDVSPRDTTCTPPPAPTVAISANGTDVTGTTVENPMVVVIGEQIALTSAISNENGASVQSQGWSIPGNLVKSYGETGQGYWTISPTCANADCQPAFVQPSELASAAVTYHWIDASNASNSCSMQSVDGQQVCFRTVKYTATLSSGESASAQATFEILQPTPTDPGEPLLSGAIGSPTIIGRYSNPLKEAMLLRRVYHFLISNNVSGIEITPNLTDPPGFAGDVYLLQVASSVEVYDQASGGRRECTYPYAFDHLYSPAEVPENDSPGVFLPDTIDRISLSDSFQTYLLWMPAFSNAIPAPLGVLPWGFTGTAETGRSFFRGRWSIDGRGTSEYVDPFVPNPLYPNQWSNYLKSPTEPHCNPL